MRKHTSGTSRPHGEMIGAGPKSGAGVVRMANPNGGRGAQANITMRPAGGKFQGGANSYKPGKMKVQRSGE